ncbi:hypothetical protein [Govanella unica]|uniref:Uncharacterized protein n=1 Tax=Govanella unica TaxID=2975056 RepID=A0A9X3TYI6_9PROT|nr:hypothetical protein [Govania unica]MDA5193884.1 hypothetical protein [Govania unica]
MSKLSWPDGLPLQEPRTLEIYDDDYIQVVMSRFNIPETLRRRLLNSLDISTRDYLNTNAAQATQLTIKERKALLSKISLLAQELDQCLDENKQHLGLLRMTEDQLYNHIDSPDSELCAIGAAIPYPGEHGTDYELVTYAQARVGLRLIKLLADKSAPALPEPKAGRKNKIGLKFWTSHLCHFWTQDLGRPLTHQVEKGVGLTASYDFLESLLRPLAAHEIPSLASTVAEQRTKFRKLRKIQG